MLDGGHRSLLEYSRYFAEPGYALPGQAGIIMGQETEFRRWII
jgi:hypothetical protein